MLLDQTGLSFEDRLRQWLDAQTLVGGNRVESSRRPRCPSTRRPPSTK